MPDYASLPVKFEDVRKQIPAGYSLSERLLEPVILLDRKDGRLSASLGGVRVIRGRKNELMAPTEKHSWVVDGKVLRPLPKDSPSLFREMMSGLDPGDIPFSAAIRLLRTFDERMSAIASKDVLLPAQDAADRKTVPTAPTGLNADLFPYQSRGVQWMWDAIEGTGGVILADEMGLGKTIQIIALLLKDMPDPSSPALIVCPTSLIANWVREIERFGPSLDAIVHRGAHRTGISSGLQKSRVVITTYDTMVNDISIFSGFEWSWVICDEAQAIKNPASNRREAIVTIPRKRSIPMTGTPVENTLLDLWSLADFAIPGLLGSQTDFEAEFPDSVEAGQRLGGLTDPIILKRRVADVATDLPKRMDIDLPLELDDRLVDHYREVRNATLEKYPVAGALVATLQLQLLCAHPWLRSNADADEEADIVPASSMPLITPKMDRCAALLREAFANDRKVIVFALFNRIGDLLKEVCADMPDVHWGAINGSTAQEERQPIVDLFSEREGAACLVLNPKAAGAGLNITAATVVIHFTPVWNPAVEAQASARAHRRGQTQPVTVYRLFYKNTVEEIMIERSAWKNELANETVPVSTRDADDLKRALSILPVKS